MASFKDSKGREWFIKLTIGKAARLKEQFGLDFVAALYDVDISYRILGEIYQDLARFPAIIHTAADITVDLAEFADSMGGEEVAAAFEALDQSFTDFHPPAKREKIAALKAEMKASLEEGQADMMPEIMEKVRTEMRGAVRKAAGTILTPGK